MIDQDKDIKQVTGKLPALTDAEYQLCINEWNDTRLTYKDEHCVPQLFEEQVECTPDDPAAIFEPEQLSYRELNRRANQMAHYLQTLGVGPDSRVGLYLEPSLDLLIALLAILKAGGAYVSIDLAYPRERVEFLLCDANVAVLLTQDRHRPRVPASDHVGLVIALDTITSELGQQPVENPECNICPDNLAYILYTSGSTGAPKGVMVAHRGLANYLRWCRQRYAVAEGAGAPVHSSLSFDLTVTSLFSPLLSGRTVVLLPFEHGVESLNAAFQTHHNLSLVKITPAHLALLSQQRDLGQYAASTRLLVIGGEQLLGEQLAFWQDLAPEMQFINEYGPTETVVGCCVYQVPKGQRITGPVPIGRPIANTRLYLLNQSLHPVPIGTPGELYIGGDGLARGYLNQPALTAERFIPDPFSAQGGARLYKTGDLARYRDDGVLEYLGRTDQQVKLRGFRIEPGEIENALRGQPEVREAVVEVREVVPGEKSLVAYVTLEPEQRVDVGMLRQRLHDVLPEYMIPAFFVLLDMLPLSVNGKLDRKALPLPERKRMMPADVAVVPRTALAEQVARIWCDVLGMEQIGSNENFFELGGHSLLATQILSRVRDAFHVDLPLRTLFEAPTIDQFVEHLEVFQESTKRAQVPPPGPVDRQKPLPLSFAQQRLWFLDQMEPLNPFYNESMAIHLSGDVHLQALLASFHALVRRHEILRTRFVSVSDSPIQVIDSEFSLPFSLISLEPLPENERDAIFIELANRAFHRPFDLSSDRLVRCLILRLSPDEHVLVISLHHIITDGWSMGVLMQELWALYKAFSTGTQSPLPALPIQYADYAVWQREWLQGELLEKQVNYWRAQLAGAPELLELPTDYPRPPVQSYHGSVHSFVIPETLTGALNTFSSQEGVTLFITLLAAFQILLARYSGQKDIVVGSPVANRTHSETEKLIGFFVNTLLLRTDLSSNPSFQQVIHQVREVCLDAYANQDIPFERLVEELHPTRNLSYHPLFQVLFVLQNTTTLVNFEIDGLQIHALLLEQQTSKFDLSVSISEHQEELTVDIGYNTDLFLPKTIERLAHHFQTLLGKLVQQATQPISTLTLLSAEEQQQILYEWNATTTDFSTSCFLHQLVEAQVDRTPEAIAVLYDSEHITFAELNRRANGVASFLRTQGIGPDILVGMYMERSIALVVGILGVLKAGGAYVPLDPNYPAGRLEYMMVNSGMKIVLTQRAFTARLANRSLQVIDIESIGVLDQEHNLAINLSPDHLAYVIYTSGSTGHPKGAMNTHRAVSNRIVWMQSEYRLNARDRLLQKTPISFDISVWEMFWPLIAGATLVMAIPEGHKDPAYLRDIIEQAEITTMQFVPSMLSIFLREQGIERCHSLRQVFCGGEALAIDDQNRFFMLFHASLNNLYGPTETAIGTSFWRCQNPATQSVVPIGHPIANTQLYVLDASLQPVPPRIAGELYIGGRGVGRGYLGDPQKTAAAFIPHPFSPLSGERLYRTGDLARYQVDGTIEFLGRVDHQVKLRGFRIELGEIEAVLLQHPDIQNASLLAQDGDNGDRYLVAYLVPVAKHSLALPEIKRYLTSHVPAYMIPAFFVVLDALPLTANGKLDRSALPLPDRAHVSANETYVAPRTTVEKLIAQVWSDVIGVEHPGIHDNFFELGGHSLLATRIMSRLREIFQRRLPLRNIFEHPDIASLAASIQNDMQVQHKEQAYALVATARPETLPLSFAQQRLWFIQQLDVQSPAYNLYTILRLNGFLHHTVLKQSLEEIVNRHEVLRTSFVEEQDELSQQVVSGQEFPFHVIRLPKADRTSQEKQANDIIAQELSRPFDLTTGPLFRGHLLVLDEQEHVLLLNMHHIISDGWSIEILMRDLTSLYASLLHGSSSSLPPLPIQYADYAIWQREWLQGEVLAHQVAYWKKQLMGAPPLLALPTDYPRPSRLSSRGAMFLFQLPASLSQQLKALGQREGATLFMTLLAAFQILLARYSGQDDILVGTPIAGRAHGKLEELIGFFVNTLVLRTDLSGAPTFQDVLHQVREVVLAADSYQDLPFEKLVEIVAPQRDPGYHPIFQVMFTLQNASTLPNEMADIQITYQRRYNDTAKFDLELEFIETAQGLAASLEYSADLFTEERMRRLSGHLQTLLEAIVTSPVHPLGELSLWSDTITLDAEELNELFDV